MGSCCSKDSDDGGTNGHGFLSSKKIFQEIGSGGANAAADVDGLSDLPQDCAATTTQSRRVPTPSYREELVALHSDARAGSGSGNRIGPLGDRFHRICSDECAVDVNDSDRGGSPRRPDEPARPAAHAAARTREAARLRNVFAAPLDMDACFVAPVRPKSDEEAAFIAEALEGHFVFSNLGEAETEALVGAFDELCVLRGTEVITQGEVGDFFYVVQRGAVTFLVDGAEVGSAGEGQSFGELALLYDCPRAATCVAAEDCVLWRVDQRTFRRILACEAMRNDHETRDALRRVPFLKDLDEKFLRRISEALGTLKYRPGEIIICKGDEGGVFYIVKSGQVKVTDIEMGQSKYCDQVLGPGGFFGERAIMTNEKRVANVTALDEVTLLCLSRDDFHRVLGDMSDLIKTTRDKRTLTALPLFGRSGISENEIDSLAGLIKDVDYSAGHVFFREGQVIDEPNLALYIVRSGKVLSTSEKGELHEISRGGYFGYGNLGAPDDGKGARIVTEGTLEVVEDCRVGVLAMSSIKDVLGSMSRLSKTEKGKSRSSLLNSSIMMEDLQKHHILGVGTFGKVWLVSRNGEKATVTFALKVQNKRDVIAHKQVNGVIREKNIMASIDSPFIIKLFNAYQDDKCLYMLMQLVQGGELFSVVHTKYGDGIPESHSKFYAAGVLQGLSYMHQRHIVYRDLKPENVLIDKNGYTVIVDLGFAKIVMDKTYTLCGTPLYLAPEVILSRGHDKGADYWSWGVLIYEMNVGVSPFYEHNISPITLLRKVVKGKYIFPRGRMSGEARDLVKQLLVAQPINRLGCFACADRDIREHKWFSNFDFDKLARKELKAPWAPKLKGVLDASNFDDLGHLNNRPDPRKAPLTATEQELFKEF